MEQYLPYLSLIIAFAGLYFNGKNNKRTDVKEIEAKAIEQAKINAKLDNLTSIQVEVRGQVSDLVRTQTDVCQRLVTVEQSTKSAHHRIDELMKDESHNR